MQQAPLSRTAGYDLVVRHLRALEHARKLRTKRSPLYSVRMKDRGVRCKARPDRRSSMVFGPIDDFRHGGPIGFHREEWCVRLGAGNDQAVETVLQHRANIFVMLADVRVARFRAPKLRYRENPHQNHEIWRRLGEQIAELTLGGLQSGVGHVVEDPDHDRLIVAEVEPMRDIS